MRRSTRLAFFGSALAFAFVANTSVASPLSPGADAVMGAAATLALVEQAHGVHRVCALGRVPRWGAVARWHRHVGAAHVPVRC